MEIQPTNDTKNMQPTKDNMSGLLLLTSVLLGMAIATLLFGISQIIPVFGVIGGAIGGIAAGMIQVFSSRVSRTIKTILLIVLIVSIIFLLTSWFAEMHSEISFFLFLYWLAIILPCLSSSLIVLSVTKAICIRLTKPPVNWWLFGLFLVVGAIISIVVMGICAAFGAALLTN